MGTLTRMAMTGIATVMDTHTRMHLPLHRSAHPWSHLTQTLIHPLSLPLILMSNFQAATRIVTIILTRIQNMTILIRTQIMTILTRTLIHLLPLALKSHSHLPPRTIHIHSHNLTHTLVHSLSHPTLHLQTELRTSVPSRLLPNLLHLHHHHHRPSLRQTLLHICTSRNITLDTHGHLRYRFILQQDWDQGRASQLL